MFRHLMTRGQLDAFADEELAETQITLVLRHLAECVDCVTALEGIYWVKMTLAASRSAAAVADLEHGNSDAAAVQRLVAWADSCVR